MMTKKKADAAPGVAWKEYLLGGSIYLVLNFSLRFGLGVAMGFFGHLLTAIGAGFLAANRETWGVVWKNLYRSPGLYFMSEQEISLTSDKSFDNLYDKDDSRTLASFDLGTRTVHSIKYKLEYDAPNEVIFDVEYENAMRGAHIIHELGHAWSAKWVMKYFWGKNKNRTLYVADELARHIEEVIGFARIPQVQRQEINDAITAQARRLVAKNPDKSVDEIRAQLIKQDWVLKAHLDAQKFVNIMERQDQDYDIFDEEYIEKFNKHLTDKDSMIMDAIVGSVKMDFITSGSRDCYVKQAKRQNLLNRLGSVDFYGRPEKYDTAKERIFDVAIGPIETRTTGKRGEFIDAAQRINILSHISDITRKHLWDSIDRWVRDKG